MTASVRTHMHICTLHSYSVVTFVKINYNLQEVHICFTQLPVLLGYCLWLFGLLTQSAVNY